MDTDIDTIMREAADLFDQGDKKQAIKLLARVIQVDPNNAKAWYGMALCVDDIEKKEYCLQKVLELKPGNRRVSQELLKISRKSKSRIKPFFVFLVILLFLCVATMLSLAGLSYFGYFENIGINNIASNQGGSISATLDATMLSHIVKTEYAKTIQGYPPTVIDPTSTIFIVDNATPTLSLIPNTTAPTLTIIPTLTIVANEITTCVPQNERVSGIVTKIIDGDTIEVAIGENVFKVRYVGIDCPEGISTQEAFGMEATQKNKDLVLGKKVILIKDISETDQYNRLLRYVFVDDIFVNYELVAQGYANTMTSAPDIACNEMFLNAEQLARNAQLGRWAPVEIAIPTESKSNYNNCDPAYPTVCIPSPPPDLDCAEISYRHFQVLPSDPHNFDGDNNGIGCEN